MCYIIHINRIILKGRDDMFCDNCGEQIEDSNFCPYCGFGVQQNWQQTADAPVPHTRSKRRIWAFIGIIAGVVVVTAAALFFILTPSTIQGQWYNEERGEVLKFNADGTMQSIHMSSTNDAVYEYDRESGKGTITLGAFSHKMQYNDGMLSITDMGEFTKAAGGFDIDKFMDKYGDSILGQWFDTEGEGVIDLHADGTYDLATYGRNLEGKYTKSKSGVIVAYKYYDQIYNFHYNFEDGMLKVDKEDEGLSINNFVREYREQKGKEHLNDDALGKWVSETVGVTLELFDDGTGVIYDINTSLTGIYEYEPVVNEGFFNADEGKTVFFMVVNDILFMADAIFYRTD